MHHAKYSRLYIIFHCGFYDFIITGNLLISSYVSIYTLLGNMKMLSYNFNFRTIYWFILVCHFFYTSIDSLTSFQIIESVFTHA